MIEDGEEFFKAHPDSETRRRGLFLIQVIDGLRDAIQRQAIKPAGPRIVTLADLETQFMTETLEEYEGNIVRSAKALGISRNGLYVRLDKLGIPYGRKYRQAAVRPD